MNLKQFEQIAKRKKFKPGYHLHKKPNGDILVLMHSQQSTLAWTVRKGGRDYEEYCLAGEVHGWYDPKPHKPKIRRKAQ